MAAADSTVAPGSESIAEDLAGLNLIELLDLLEPVPTPEPISLLPQTPLWGWLAALLLLLAARFAYRYWRRWRANAYRRAALAEIDGAGNDPAVLSAILRRTALCAFPRESVASLYGTEWLQFLDRHCPQGGFDSEAGLILAQGPYDPSLATGSPELEKLAAHWIRNHRAADAGDGS